MSQQSNIQSLIQGRREGIKRLLTSGSNTPVSISDWSPKDESEQDSVWVDGQVLRSFLRQTVALIDDDMVTALRTACRSSCSPLDHTNLFCEHGKGLPPSVARRGKWITRKIYDSLNQLIIGELEEKMERTEPITMSRIRCDICSEEYSSRLQGKVELLNKLAEVHELLDPAFVDENITNDEVRNLGCLLAFFALVETVLVCLIPILHFDAFALLLC